MRYLVILCLVTSYLVITPAIVIALSSNSISSNFIAKCHGTRLELGLSFDILDLIGLGLFIRRKTRKKSRNRRVAPLIIEQIAR